MKRGKKMILLMVLLGVMLVGYGMIGRIQTNTQVSENEGMFPLWSEGKEVASLAWNLDGTAYSFAMGESVWMKTDDAVFPVNQTVVDNLAGKIEALSASRELTDVSDPADYGLAQPAFSVTVTDADGNEVTYAMGDETPFADGYYLSVTGKEAIYVIDDSLADVFDKTITELAEMETMPETTTVTRLTVGDTLDVTYDDATQAWHDTATGEALDGEAVDTLVSAATGLAWSELIATHATDEELAEWMLDDAQAVSVTAYNGEAAELCVLVGGEDVEGDRYARLPDSKMVYTFYSGDVDDLLAAGIDSLWKKTPETMTIDQLGEAVFAWEGGEKTLAAEDAEATGAQSIFDQLAALEGTARVALGEAGETILSVRMTDADGAQKTLEIQAYSVDSYLVPTTDTHGMLVPAEDVDKLIRVLKTAG